MKKQLIAVITVLSITQLSSLSAFSFGSRDRSSTGSSSFGSSTSSGRGGFFGGSGSSGRASRNEDKLFNLQQDLQQIDLEIRQAQAGSGRGSRGFTTNTQGEVQRLMQKKAKLQKEIEKLQRSRR